MPVLLRLALVLLLVFATPSAAAAEPICEEVARVSYDVDGRALASLADARPGERVVARVEADVSCEGYAFTLVSFARGDDRIATHDAGWARASVSEGVARAEVAATMPACSFRVQLIAGRVGDGAPVESADVDAAPCAWRAPPACPEDVVAVSRAGVVNLRWASVAGADEYRIHRAAGDEGIALLATTWGNTSFVDRDVVLERVYAYAVLAVVEDVASEACGVVRITAVPFVGAPVLGALALLAALGAFASLRRR